MVTVKPGRNAQTINIFDFDHTIYDGDASLDFFAFSLKRRPWLAVYAPYQFLTALLFLIRVISRTKFKQNFFIFLRGVGDTNLEVNDFWDRHEDRVKAWYRERDHKSDVIISASPDFLIGPIAKRIGAQKLIATIMDSETGVISGYNCRGEEKAVRLRKEFASVVVRECYSDSLSDLPILNLAKNAYIVKGDDLTPLKSFLSK